MQIAGLSFTTLIFGKQNFAVNLKISKFLGNLEYLLNFFGTESSYNMAGKMEIKLANDVYRCCFHHALSSQAEEVMGILIGEKISEEDGTTVIEGNY